MANPIEWLAWIYGKWFIGHAWRGFFALLSIACIVVFVLLGALWLKALDEYSEKHPKPGAATFSSSASPSVAASTESKGEQKTTTTALPKQQKQQAIRTKTHEAGFSEQTNAATVPASVACGDGRTAPTLKDCGNIDLEIRDNRFSGVAPPDLSNAHRSIFSGNILEHQPAHTSAAQKASDADESEITVTDNSVRGTKGQPNAPNQPAALFDVKQLDRGCFDNNTVVGSMEILKADKANSVTATNNVGYSNPNARPQVTGNSRSYNFNNWLDFLDEFDGIAVEGKSPTEHLAKLRARLESEWVGLLGAEKERRRHELDFAMEKLKMATPQTYWSVTEPLRHRENVPQFVRMPCQ